MMPALNPSDARLAALLEELRRQLRRVDPVSLHTWAEAIADQYRQRARTTRLRVAQALREVRDLLPSEATTADLTPAVLDRFVAADRGRAWATLDGLLRALRAACSAAVRAGWIEASPFATWDRWPQREQPRRRHLPESEVARLLDSLRARASTWSGARLFTLAAVWAYCGLRRDEALRLQVHDVDLERGVIHVRPHGRRLKTHASAAPVPIPSALASILVEWLPRTKCVWVFPGLRRTGPWTGGTSGKRAGDQLRKAAESIGLVGVTPHTLRHSLATSLAHRGFSPRQTQLVLRHSNQLTQAYYVHPDEPALCGLMRGFDWRA